MFKYRCVFHLFFLILFVAAFSLSSFANSQDPTYVVTLDPSQPVANGSYYNWDYTLTVTDANVFDVINFTIEDVAGVVGASAPNFNWTPSYASIGGGLYDVTFTNDPQNCNQGCSLDGFIITSTDSTSKSEPYSIEVFGKDPGGTVDVAAAPVTTPEPGTSSLLMSGLLGLGLLAGSKGCRGNHLGNRA